VSGRPRTPWGWHRLADHWAERIVADAGIRAGDLVLDIGAGTGALTERLVARGARVIAIELHRGRAQVLRDRFRTRSVRVVEADAADLRLPRRPFRVVANPPFAMTAPILKRLLSRGSRLTAADVVVPEHVARRWVGRRAPGMHRWSSTFGISVGRTLPARAFDPASTVTTVVLQIRRLDRARDSWQQASSSREDRPSGRSSSRVGRPPQSGGARRW
jgi:23S rRNA (adenine-N6)-dimethyltransferase